MSDAVDVGGGALSGAAQGFSVAGPVGAVVGGILGAVGGLFKSKSKKYARYADAEQQKLVDRQNAMQRRDIVRNLYLARSQALAAGASESGGLQSSTVQGGLSSLASQGVGNLNYFDAQLSNITTRNSYLAKAGKAADTASGIGSLIDVGASLYKGASDRGKVPSYVTFGSIFKPPSPSGGSRGGYRTI